MSLSAAEMQSALAPGKSPASASGEKRVDATEEVLRRFDQNGDGRLDDDEWRAAREELERRMKAGKARPEK